MSTKWFFQESTLKIKVIIASHKPNWLCILALLQWNVTTWDEIMNYLFFCRLVCRDQSHHCKYAIFKFEFTVLSAITVSINCPINVSTAVRKDPQLHYSAVNLGFLSYFSIALFFLWRFGLRWFFGFLGVTFALTPLSSALLRERKTVWFHFRDYKPFTVAVWLAVFMMNSKFTYKDNKS